MSEGALATRGAWPARGETALVAVVCGAALAESIVLVGMGTDAYEAVLGIAHPVSGTAVVVGLGFAGWLILVRGSWIPARDAESGGYRLAAACGLVLPVPVIVVDCLGGFGPEINVSFPDAIFFYSSIAVVAELVFHVMPLTVAALVSALARLESRVLEALGVVAAVTLESALQVAWGAGASPAWASAYVGFHLLVFNVLGVYLLRRYGMLCVILYRLSYYAVWHVGWGYVRIPLLFSA